MELHFWSGSSKYNQVICPGQVYEDAGIIYL